MHSATVMHSTSTEVATSADMSTAEVPTAPVATTAVSAAPMSASAMRKSDGREIHSERQDQHQSQSRFFDRHDELPFRWRPRSIALRLNTQLKYTQGD